MVARSAFRSDLFFRIQCVGLPLPALRERTADIRPIAIHHGLSRSRLYAPMKNTI
jgi:transcriptional regulator with GAF, ATPase, and Fis domain